MSQQIYTSQKATCVHAFKLWPYTSAEKHSAAWLHPTLPQHAFAKPHHSPHPLLALLTHQRNVPLLVWGSATPLHLATACTHKRRYILCLRPSCQWSLPPRPKVPAHQPCVCDLALLSPESAWSSYPPPLQLASKMEESSTTKDDHAATAAI